MDELITWLRERLDHRERVAREAVGKGLPTWTIDPLGCNSEPGYRKEWRP